MSKDLSQEAEVPEDTQDWVLVVLQREPNLYGTQQQQGPAQ